MITVTGVQTCALPISPKPQNPFFFDRYSINITESAYITNDIQTLLYLIIINRFA